MSGAPTTSPPKLLLTSGEEKATLAAARGLPAAGYRIAALCPGGLSPIFRSNVRGSFA